MVQIKPVVVADESRTTVTVRYAIVLPWLQGRRVQSKIVLYLHESFNSLHVPRERPSRVRISVLVPLNEFKTFCLVVRQSRLEEYRVHSELSV